MQEPVRGRTTSRTRTAPEPELAVIESLSHDGRGVARLDGKTVFVSDALPGERVLLRRLRRRRRHDEAELVEVIEPSPDRVTPRCAHFGACGGCVLQHLAPARQLEAKQQVLIDNLERLGKVSPAALLAPLSGAVWNYRRRARLAARYVHPKGRVLVGFRERRKPIVADMRGCEVLAPPADRLIEPLARLIESTSLKQRIPQIEVSVADNCVALVFRVLDEPDARDLELLGVFAREHALQVYLQPGGPQTARPLAGTQARPAYGLPAFDVTIEFEPTDFVQVNADLNRRMVSRTVELLDPGRGDHVLDLFCGVGNFSLPLARRAARVDAVEGDEALVARARANAALNGLNNLAVHVADLAADLGELAWARERYDLLLLDPPRTGAGALLPMIPVWAPRRIVYVSCHPGTLARDAGELVRAHGYRLQRAGVIDMFAHTAHVESLAVFERAADGG